MIEKKLVKDYARLLALKGLNVQKGQEVIVFCEIDQPEFVKIVCDELYKFGAKKVFVDFSYQPITALGYKKQTLSALSSMETFEEAKWKWRAETLPCHLYLISEDPFGLSGVKDEKITKSNMARYPVIKPYRKSMEAKYQWCIAAVPGKSWAKRVFPELSVQKAVEKLWRAILSASLVDGNAVENWNAHNETVKKKCEYLNSLKLRSLHYLSSNGTDFTVELNERGEFHGGADKTLKGVLFNPNIPSYEVFTSPIAGKCEGRVVATKPLSYKGKIIDKFEIVFKNGKAVSATAEKGEELLNQIIKMDEGAAMLGECALVPYNNPINDSGILFYETLFDENACCHLALGEGFPETLSGYENMTQDEIKKAGINDSMIHVDFMIGSLDLKIVGTCADGKQIVIFDKGNWA